ncbi:hypothetical protein [Pseudomonas sp. 28 E 9]|nr:hypothetical protein [Pseudomonas sp. 28 E 9]
MRVNHSPGLPHLVSNYGRNHTREERVVTHASNSQNLKPEQSTGKRGAENGGKACTDTGHENHPTIFSA